MFLLTNAVLGLEFLKFVLAEYNGVRVLFHLLLASEFEVFEAINGWIALPLSLIRLRHPGHFVVSTRVFGVKGRQTRGIIESIFFAIVGPLTTLDLTSVLDVHLSDELQVVVIFLLARPNFRLKFGSILLYLHVKFRRGLWCI